ncbi:prolipoprotein diacylglyceryl transferase [Pseudarthrobacter sp. MDT3-26]|uniref:prolipoprotein diacylglyceryl transferase n=1 Tax=Pseudarthrobacter raffinosi TaxID=2953651 RepID=UPI00208F99B0|nr:prolipoprotein diacylglyceryl transferase family protein [Pseudarthrobacter sp. MDT3-26]MCO4265211.1 prolipoprotein diacylglyceryl transferase [Pseudarthrobacter sp. MDT3-26]
MPAPPADSVPAPTADKDHRGFFDSLDPQGLAGTYWIDTDTWEGPENVSVRFSGIRAASEPGAPPEQFETYEDVDSIRLGTGRIAVTSRVTGISAGTWNLTLSPVPRAERAASPAARTALPGTAPASSTAQTRFAALAQGPGVNLASWPLLVGSGAILAVVLQAIFLTLQGIDPVGALWLTVLANTVGGVGARLWWLALKRQPLSNFLQAGACIQGFLAGALATVIIGSLIFGLPVGRILDATAAGLFFAMALGRPGCFFTGCCAGRPTASRWGRWSSDRRLGRRRHPVQLYEAFLALLIGLGSLPFMLAGPPNIPGLVFITTVTAYTLGRQLLFPLREDSRTLRGRTLTIAVCILVLGAVILLAATS